MASRWIQKVLDKTNSDPEDHDKSCTNPAEDSYIARCLREYYMKKFYQDERNKRVEFVGPSWLPPDPNAKSNSSNTVIPALAHSPATSIASAPGSLRQNKGGLGDVFDDNNGSNVSIQSANIPRRPGFRALGSQRASNSTDTVPTRNAPPQNQEPAPAARPLPSQRAGSYQRREVAAPSWGNAQPVAGSNRQERLKAKLGGGSGGRNVASVDAPDEGSSGSGNPYANNDARGAYGANGSINPYAQAAGQPYTGASSSWTSGEDTVLSNGGASEVRRKGVGLTNGRVGLPSGPRLR